MRISIIFSSFVLFVAGCGKPEGNLKGTVTFNGNPVEDGDINFSPLDEHNSTHGAKIENGKYTAKIPPGRYTIIINGGAKLNNYPKSQADLKDVSNKDLELKDQIPDNATGNGQEIEVKPGSVELNFALESPVKK